MVLTLNAVERGEFVLRAAKRRPPWPDGQDRQAYALGLRHTTAGVWESFAVDPETVRTGRPKAPAPEAYRAAVLDLVFKSGAMPKTLFTTLVQAFTGTRNQARAAIDLLLADRSLVAWAGVGRGGSTMVGLPSQVSKVTP